jgi:hypothetical protein
MIKTYLPPGQARWGLSQDLYRNREIAALLGISKQ